MNTMYTNPSPACVLIRGEIEVLALMGRRKFTIREIKDAVQRLGTTDMEVVEAYLLSKATC